jgi:hypothetical protein
MHSFAGAPDFIKKLLSFVHEMKGIPPYYILAVAVYLIPNVLAAFLFLFPMLRRWIENSDWHIIRLLLWWSQVLCTILPNLLPYLIIFLHNHGLHYFIRMMLPMYLFTLWKQCISPPDIIKIRELDTIFINFIWMEKSLTRVLIIHDNNLFIFWIIICPYVAKNLCRTRNAWESICSP